MGRYYYPSAPDALSAKKMFLREHGYKIPHCFQNTWGTGYVLFDSKADVNSWHKEHTGEPFYKEEYEPGTVFTKNVALQEIEHSYGHIIDDILLNRDMALPLLALGLPSTFGNRIFLQFVKTSEEKDIAYRFYLHYDGFILEANPNISNNTLREQIVSIIYKSFYSSRFKKRIEGSNHEIARRDEEKKAIIAERERIERGKKLEYQRKEDEARRKQREIQIAIERERKYKEALVKYEVDIIKYETEMKLFNEAMALKKKYTHGGQFPNCAWLICFLLFIILIFGSMLLTLLEDRLPYGILLFMDIVLLFGGYRLLFKKLKPYLAETYFDEKGFEQWVNKHPRSPIIRYVHSSWAPSKPIRPIR